MMHRVLFRSLALTFFLPAIFACGTKDVPDDPGPAEQQSFIHFSSDKEFRITAEESVLELSFETAETWTAMADKAWLTLDSVYGSAGSNTVSLTVRANGGYEDRSGMVVFSSGTAKDTVHVVQAEMLDFFIGDEIYDCSADGGMIEVPFVTNTEFEILIDEDCRDWISISEDTKALEAGSFALSIARNATLYKREGLVSVAAASKVCGIKIRQDGQEPVFEAKVSDRNLSAEDATFQVEVNSNLELSVTVPSWISCSIGDGVCSFRVSANNEDKARSASVVISNAEFSKKASFTVTQKSLKSLYILAVGNSFSWDAMEYLAQILREIGYTDVFLGNLYIGGCTLQTHASNVESGSGAYQYRTTTNGSWSSENAYSSLTAMKSRLWDFVSVQQASGYSGIPDSYEPYLGTVMEAFKTWCPEARRMWHMTWAYQGNSSHSDFAKYGNDQMTMYNAIINAVKTKVLARGDFDFVIPCGTVVQNLRTSFLGDNITRDGYHMSYDVGRLATALMWARQITGRSIQEITFKPSSYSYSDKTISAIKECVENAYNNPYSVTESGFSPEPIVSEEAEAIIAANGYDPSGYSAVDLRLTHNGYYNSSANSSIVTSASNSNQFAATRIFGRSEIPDGTLLILKTGFQYRPEGWVTLTTANSSGNRPGEVTTRLVEVDDAWWDNWNYRAFNISKVGKPALDAAGQAELDNAFFVYVPKP